MDFLLRILPGLVFKVVFGLKLKTQNLLWSLVEFAVLAKNSYHLTLKIEHFYHGPAQ